MPTALKMMTALLRGTHLLGAQLGHYLAHQSALSDYVLCGPSPSFLPPGWVFGLSLAPFLSLSIKIMYDVNVFEKKQQKLVFVFRPKDIFFDFRTKYLFGPA